MVTFRPSDVVLSAYFPLGGTLGRSELECAAALVIWTLRRNGNVWRRVWRDEMQACPQLDFLSGVEPMHSWGSNPFFHPDLRGLEARHFATFTGHTLELTELALQPIGQRWLGERGG